MTGSRSILEVYVCIYSGLIMSSNWNEQNTAHRGDRFCEWGRGFWSRWRCWRRSAGCTPSGSRSNLVSSPRRTEGRTRTQMGNSASWNIAVSLLPAKRTRHRRNSSMTFETFDTEAGDVLRTADRLEITTSIFSLHFHGPANSSLRATVFDETCRDGALLLTYRGATGMNLHSQKHWGGSRVVSVGL